MKTNKRINILTTTNKKQEKETHLQHCDRDTESQYQSQSDWIEVKDGGEWKRKKSKTLDYKFKCKKLNTHFIVWEMFSQSVFFLSLCILPCLRRCCIKSSIFAGAKKTYTFIRSQKEHQNERSERKNGRQHRTEMSSVNAWILLVGVIVFFALFSFHFFFFARFGLH